VTEKELAIKVVGSTAIVIEGNKEHDNQDALVNADMSLSLHKSKIKVCCQSDRALPCFLFKIGEWRRPDGGPFDQPILAHSGNVDAVVVAIRRNHAFGDTLRLAIRIDPATDQLLAAQFGLLRIRESRV